ncbi:hypothetical protein [Paraburkholderia sp. J12]|uniref:hypothetical protein n=1 Tax=Paraburkholderia sp. J12 TaxID=2805432 RepID=UPI002ABD52D5|nr:hypothetical protein [Paraburkholderia sp. J12]
MKTQIRKRLHLAGTTGLIALTGGLAVPGLAQSSGTITFIGAVVAPPFEIAVTPARTAATTTNVVYDSSGEAGTSIRLTALPGSSPVADIALIPAGPMRQGSEAVSREVEVKLSNQAGRQIAADATGHYRLDAQGALMMLKPAYGAGAPQDASLVVLVSYN